MRSLFGRRSLLDTDGRPVPAAVVRRAWFGEQPCLDVVRRAVCDAVAGVCGPELARIIARDGSHGAWCTDVEDAASALGDAIFHDWVSGGEPGSLYDIMEVHVMEIKSSAPELVLGPSARAMLDRISNGAQSSPAAPRLSHDGVRQAAGVAAGLRPR